MPSRIVPTGIAWYYLFHEGFASMHRDPAELLWVNDYAPAAIAPYLIYLLSVGGCAMMTFFFAQIVYSMALGYTQGLFKGFRAKPATE